MNINDLQQIFSTTVTQENELLNDFSKGSVLYTLGRAISTTVYEQLNAISNQRDNFFWSTSRGSSLDSIAALHGVTRKTGSYASGSALYTSSSQNNNNTEIINPGTIFTDPISSSQYISLNSSPITTYSFTEVRIPLLATAPGFIYNISANKNLICSVYPTSSCQVGAIRNVNGVVCGDIIGGTDIESDTELRSRISQTLLGSNSLNTQNFYNKILSLPFINYVQLDIPISGYLRIAIDSSNNPLSNSQSSELNSIINKYLPVGIIYSINYITHKNIDIRLYINFLNNNNLNYAITTLKQFIFNYFYKNSNKSINLETLATLIQSTYSISVSFSQPNTLELPALPFGSIYYSSSIEVNLNEYV